MGHRTVKRVPLGFDAPLKDVWAGYVMPDALHLQDCLDCEATGYSPQARAFQETAWRHNAGEVGCWIDKLTQGDVDYLVAEGHLRALRRREPTEDNPRDWEWVAVPRSAEEVNAANAKAIGLGIGELEVGSMQIHALVTRRCEQIGAPHSCGTCDGHADVGTVEQRAAYEAWKGTEPPEGPAFQLWETTSEGSPVSPPFASLPELAEWCATGATAFGRIRWSREDWLASFTAGTTDTDTMLIGTIPVPDDE